MRLNLSFSASARALQIASARPRPPPLQSLLRPTSQQPPIQARSAREYHALTHYLGSSLLTLHRNCKGTCIHPEYWCRFLSLGGKIFCNKCGDFLRDNGFARPGSWSAVQPIHPPPIRSIGEVVLPHDLALKLSGAAFEKIRQDHNTAVLRRTDPKELSRTPPSEQFVDIIWKTLTTRKYIWKLMRLSNAKAAEEGRKDEDIEMVDAPAEVPEDRKSTRLNSSHWE